MSKLVHSELGIKKFEEVLDATVLENLRLNSNYIESRIGAYFDGSPHQTEYLGSRRTPKNTQLGNCAASDEVIWLIVLFDNYLQIEFSDHTFVRYYPSTWAKISTMLTSPAACVIHNSCLESSDYVYSMLESWKAFFVNVRDLVLLGNMENGMIAFFAAACNTTLKNSLHIHSHPSCAIEVIPFAYAPFNTFAKITVFASGFPHIFSANSIDPGFVVNTGDIVKKIVLKTAEETIMETCDGERDVHLSKKVFEKMTPANIMEIENKIISLKKFPVPLNFLRSPSFVTFSGFFSPKWMSLILHANLEALHFCNITMPEKQSFLDLAVQVPKESNSLTNFYLDARSLPLNSMIDTISIFHFIMAKDSAKFSKITFIVNDFSLLPVLKMQVQQLLSHLFAHIPSCATLITTLPLDTVISKSLIDMGFAFTHSGYIKNKENEWELFEYFSKCYFNCKTVIFGFKCTRIGAVAETDFPII